MQVGAFSGVLITAGACTLESRERRRIRALFEAGGRAATLVGTVGLIAVDYKIVGWRSQFMAAESSETRARDRYVWTFDFIRAKCASKAERPSAPTHTYRTHS